MVSRMGAGIKSQICLNRQSFLIFLLLATKVQALYECLYLV